MKLLIYKLAMMTLTNSYFKYNINGSFNGILLRTGHSYIVHVRLMETGCDPEITDLFKFT